MENKEINNGEKDERVIYSHDYSFENWIKNLPVDSKIIKPVVYQPELDLDKIQTVEDCKKIIDVLFKSMFKPLSPDYRHGVLSDIYEYIKK